eukprot:3055922-Rhodomonas_salina.1
MRWPVAQPSAMIGGLGGERKKMEGRETWAKAMCNHYGLEQPHPEPLAHAALWHGELLVETHLGSHVTSKLLFSQLQLTWVVTQPR